MNPLQYHHSMDVTRALHYASLGMLECNCANMMKMARDCMKLIDDIRRENEGEVDRISRMSFEDGYGAGKVRYPLSTKRERRERE